MNWIGINKQRPKLGQTAIIFEQGYDVTGKHYFSHYHIGTYIKIPRDKRKRGFGNHIHVFLHEKLGEPLAGVWIYGDITHWMPLPAPPEKIKRAR